MTDRRDLLFELGTEELPPMVLPALSAALGEGIVRGLSSAALTHGEAELFATPRRLAVLVRGVAARQPEVEQTRRGPALAAAFDARGNPTPAAQGFARSCGVSVEELATEETAKGKWLSYQAKLPGQAASSLLPSIILDAVNALPIPKRMRWGDGEAEFVRPVHWIVLLFGDAVIDADIFGIPAGRFSRGHRFHHPQPIAIGTAAEYASRLAQEGKVIADFSARRKAIENQTRRLGEALGGTAVVDQDLLDEVTALVEWPAAFSGGFDPAFLDLPREILISTMQDHQKYLHVLNQEGGLLPCFIGVANIDSTDAALVRQGNERVIRPRLSDAAFFYAQDRRQPLAARIAGLQQVVFQEKLGTLFDRSRRISELGRYIAVAIGADPAAAARAGELCKCDLLTEVVGEFPELQGIMGEYYAGLDGEPAEVACAIREQYLPRFAGDRLPASAAGTAVALAEKIDTLVGIFALEQAPRGDSDPFALRCSALGALRIMIEKHLDLDLLHTLEHALQGLPAALHNANVVSQVFDFMLERLRAYYLDDGVSHDVFEAVLSRRPSAPYDFEQRIQAVMRFRELPEAESLAAANKRITNILKKAGSPVTENVKHELFVEPEEQALAEKLAEVERKVSPLFAAPDYTAALTELSGLRRSVDRFFDAVMVMCDDERVRDNRLALLNSMRQLFLRVADISLLQKN